MLCSLKENERESNRITAQFIFHFVVYLSREHNESEVFDNIMRNITELFN